MLRRDFLAVSALASAAALTTAMPAQAKTNAKPAAGGRVDGILVLKSERKMHLVSNRKIVKTYKINLGFSPVGHKQFQGDGKTPEGTYYITHKNPYSRFHLSLGVSYPSRADLAYARRHGRSPGGDIFIHGTGRGAGRGVGDWTWGCIAVTDAEMDEIYSLIAPRTRITIKA